MENQVINKVERVNPFANMNEIKVITNMENDKNNNIDNFLSNTEKSNILAYCKNKLNEIQTYIRDFSNIDELYNYLNDGFAECDWSSDTQINDTENHPNDNVHHFTFIFDQIMIDGYVTPYGTILSKIMSYNPFNEEGDLYKVNLNTYEVTLM